MKRVLLIFFVFLCLCSVDANSHGSERRKITFEQARTIVFAALTSEQRRLPGLAIDNPTEKNPKDISTYEDPDRPGFLTFLVVWAQPIDGGSVNVGIYSVDPYTGDIFDGVAGTCEGIKNKKLETIQKNIRHSLRLTATQYHKIKTKGPLCME